MKHLASLISLAFVCALSAAPVVKSGNKISFLGDSITGLGTYHETGYVNLVIDGLKSVGINAVRMPAGKGGDKAPMMLARMQRDSLAYKPDFMTLSCGVNDVWHSLKKSGVELPEYEKCIREIVKNAKKAGVKVMILTPTIIYEDLNNDLNKKLAGYIAFLKKLAAEEGCIFVDTNAAVQDELKRLRRTYPNIKGNVITIDGIHMNPMGDAAMAKAILRGFGLTEKEIAAAESGWGKRFFFSGMAKIRLKDFKKILSCSEANKTTVSAAFNLILDKAFENCPQK